MNSTIDPASRNSRVYDAIVKSGTEGETSAQLSELCGCSKNAILTAIACLNQQGRYVYGSGPQAMRRYFASQEAATAYGPVGERLRKELVQATYRRAMKRRNERRAVARSTGAAKKANEIAERLRNSRPAPVRIPARKQPATVDMNGVKVTVCPSWTHDVRYSVEPGRRVIGEFTTEWRQRRAA